MYLTFDNTQTQGGVTLFPDNSGNGHNAVLVGNVTAVSGGVINGAALFDQTNAATQVATTQVQGINSLAGSFTVTVWMNTPTLYSDTHMKIASSKLNWDDTSGWELEYYPAADRLSFVGSGSTVATANSVGIAAGKWNFIAASVVGGNAYFYVNATPVTTTTAVSPVVARTDRDLFVGSNDDIGGIFTGMLDEFTIFSGVVDPAAIQALFEAQAAGRGAISTSAQTYIPTSNAGTSTTDTTPSGSTDQQQPSSGDTNNSNTQNGSTSTLSSSPDSSNTDTNQPAGSETNSTPGDDDEHSSATSAFTVSALLYFTMLIALSAF
jgi:hypothetical protein